MNIFKRSFSYVSTALLVTAAGAAQAATPIEVKVTADNEYAIYTGSSTTATSFVGANGSWPTVETYNFNLPDNEFIYVAAYTDDLVAQGFLAQFTNLSNGNVFYSHDPQWRVTATGINKGSGSAAPTLAELSTQIQLANAGSNPSNGWVAPSVGGFNGTTPWGNLAAISPQARWTWYNSGKDGAANSYPVPFDGFNHDEYLVFRIAVAAAPTGVVPEPTSFALVLAGLAVVVAGARAKRKGVDQVLMRTQAL